MKLSDIIGFEKTYERPLYVKRLLNEWYVFDKNNKPIIKSANLNTSHTLDKSLLQHICNTLNTIEDGNN